MIYAFAISGLVACSDGSSENSQTNTSHHDSNKREHHGLPPHETDSTELPIATSWIKGPIHAPVTIVVFSDFECPYCKGVEPAFETVLSEYPETVRLVMKHHPLQHHPHAHIASRTALAAGLQNKFWEMHEKLFQNQDTLTKMTLEEAKAAYDLYATQLQLDLDTFQSDRDSNDSIKQEITRDLALAKKLGVRTTPTIFVNGARLPIVADRTPVLRTTIQNELKAIKEYSPPLDPNLIYSTRVSHNRKQHP